MTGFEPWISGVGSNCSTIWATTLSTIYYLLYHTHIQCDPDVRIKRRPISIKGCIKITTSVFTYKNMFVKWPKSQQKFGLQLKEHFFTKNIQKSRNLVPLLIWSFILCTQTHILTYLATSLSRLFPSHLSIGTVVVWNQCDQIWQKITSLRQIFDGLFLIWQNAYGKFVTLLG